MTADDRNSAAMRSGRPRLVVATGGNVEADTAAAAGVERAFLLERDLVTLGSAGTQAIRIPSADAAAAEIRWDPETEDWVFTDLTGGHSQVDGARAVEWRLHHGDRVDVGDATFIFQRDEVADHGPAANVRRDH
jgi:hypothetical protein